MQIWIGKLQIWWKYLQFLQKQFPLRWVFTITVIYNGLQVLRVCVFLHKRKKSRQIKTNLFLKFSFSQNKLFTFSVSFCIEALFWKKGLYLYRRQWWPQTSSWSHFSSSHYTVLHTRIPLSIIDACSFICYMNFSPYTQESQTSVESFT